MGKLEESVRKEIRRTKINTTVIRTIAAVGIISIGLVMPNVLGALARLGFIRSREKNRSVRRSITRLIQSGYVIVEKGSARLTPKGEKFAALLGEGRLASKKPKRWDGKWRVLIFDIPEKRRRLRVHVRQALISLGFVRLQDSVWVYPYDCEDIITMFKIDRHIGKDVLYMVVDRIENDKHLRLSFGLPAQK